MGELTQETRDELLMAVAEAISRHDGTADDAARRYLVKVALQRANYERKTEAG